MCSRPGGNSAVTSSMQAISKTASSRTSASGSRARVLGRRGPCSEQAAMQRDSCVGNDNVFYVQNIRGSTKQCFMCRTCMLQPSRETCRETQMVNGVHVQSAFLTSGHSKHFTVLPKMHSFTHQRRCQPCKPARWEQSGRDVLLRDTSTFRRHGDRTGNFPLTRQPTLPPEPHAAHKCWKQ